MYKETANAYMGIMKIINQKIVFNALKNTKSVLIVHPL